MGLAIGVAIAGLMQLLIQIPPLMAAGLLPKPSLQADHPGVSKILKVMVPALFGVSVSQINLLLDTVLASLVGLRIGVLALLLRPLDGAAAWCDCNRGLHRHPAEAVS
jgi:peptidoglycan biosynthesis protein MviN/MurJ (putative lipid II flippase)